MGRRQTAIEKKFNTPKTGAQYVNSSHVVKNTKPEITLEKILKQWDMFTAYYHPNELEDYFRRVYKNGGKIYRQAYKIKHSKLAKALK